jgi:hypothetical protein
MNPPVMTHITHSWFSFTTHGLVSQLISKFINTSGMAQEQESNWQAFHESLNKDQTSEWESMSVAPYQENGAWTSVFLMKETAGVFDMRKRQ